MRSRPSASLSVQTSESSPKSSEYYELDDLVPDVVLSPASVDELASSITELRHMRQAVVVWGGGTRIHIGNRLKRYDVALDMRSLSGNIECVAEDMVCISDAGVTVSEVNSVLKKYGLRLPFIVEHPELATIGGSLASNAPGRLRGSLGGIRDWVIGMKVVLGDGRIVKSGGRVVKNVQGFDLHRLHIGAFGTLGIIADVAFKLNPLPSRTTLLFILFKNLHKAHEMRTSVFYGPFIPESIELFIDSSEPSGEATVLVELAGVPGQLERMIDSLISAAKSARAASIEEISPEEAETKHKFIPSTQTKETVEIRIFVHPSNIASVLERLRIIAYKAHGWRFNAKADLLFGSAFARFEKTDEKLEWTVEEIIGACRSAVAESDGSFLIEKCPLGTKDEIDIFGERGNEFAIIRRLKDHFDPDSVLNPGRFLGRL